MGGLDVLCLGHASYDLVFSVSQHPAADEKAVADSLLSCGGGPAANAAVCIAKLGMQAGFCGYLGKDVYGESHLQELQANGVDTLLVTRGDSPTPLSAVLVKPDGKRSLINYKGDTQALPANAVNFTGTAAKVLLFDGHEPHISLALLAQLNGQPIPSVLDAGSLHDGTRALTQKVDYLVASEKFALQYAGCEQTALMQLSALAPTVVITLGERGLLWRRGSETGALSAPPIPAAIDTTGAGDAFHGAFAAGLAANLAWQDLLRYASAAGALCCTQLGARPGLPNKQQVTELLTNWPN
jgi:sulfofructose kinase